jgi:hypothetical protein
LGWEGDYAGRGSALGTKHGGSSWFRLWDAVKSLVLLGFSLYM